MQNHRLDASQLNWMQLRSFLALYRYRSTAAADCIYPHVCDIEHGAEQQLF